MGKIFSVSLQVLLVCGLVFGFMLPAGAAPAESGVYTEDFSSYDHVDFTDQVVWDKFSPQLRLRRVNGFDAGYWYFYSALAWADDHSFYVVWTDLHSAVYAVYAQRLDANGNRLWPVDLLVGEGEIADVAADSHGNAVVVWRSGEGMHLKKINPDGATLLDAVPVPGCGDIPIIYPSADHTRFWVSCSVWSNPEEGNYYAVHLDADDLANSLYAGQINTELVQSGNRQQYSMVVDASGALWAAWYTGGDIHLQSLNPGDGSRKWPQDLVFPGGEWPTLSPAPEGGVYFKSKGFLQRLNPDGAPVWEQPLSVYLGENDSSFDTDVQGNLWVARSSGDNIIIHKVTPDGGLLFGNGIWIRSAASQYGVFPKIRLNSNGKAAVVFGDNRSGVYELRLQMLAPDGALAWPAERLFSDDFGAALQDSPAVAVAEDGTSYLAWKDSRLGDTHIFVQSLSSSGERRWGAEMLVSSPTLGAEESRPQVVVLNASQHVLVAWFQGALYLQKFDSNGNRIWPEPRRLLDVDWYHPLLVEPTLAAAPDGGFAAVWVTTSALHVQRFDAEGVAVWPSDYTYPGSSSTTNQSLAVALAPDGGVWAAFTMDLTVTLLRVDAAGQASWPQPMPVYTQMHTVPSFTLVADGAGNAILAWSDSGLTMSQKISPAGEKLWNNGNYIEVGSLSVNSAIALVAPGNRPTYVGATTNALRVVQLDAGGALLYDYTHPIVNSWLFAPLGAAATNAAGDILAAWEDMRNGNTDVYAHKLNADASLDWAGPVQVVIPDLFLAGQGSARSNSVDVLPGRILEANLTADYDVNGGSVEYFLSNDGGATWEAITPGVNHRFSTSGSDLRWRVDLASDPLWPRGPLVRSVRIDYSALPPGADDYEVDDACSQAQPIETAGAAQLHTFHAAGDEDWVQLEAAAGQICLIQVNNAGVNADPALELYDACGGNLIASADNPGGHDTRLEWAAPADGLVVLRVVNTFGVSAGDAIGYELSIRAFDPSPIVIIAAGEAPTPEQQAALDHSADLAYNTFRSAGVVKAHLRYFSPSSGRDVDGNGLDDDIFAGPDPGAIRDSIQDWARLQGAEFGIPVYIVLIGPGDTDMFYTSSLPEGISANELNLWIANLEATSGADAVNVIIEATRSGSFIDITEAGPATISGHNRVILTSTSSALDSYLTPEGAYFSNALFNALGQDLDLQAAFEQAEAVVQAGGLEQQPWIDDNGDAWADNQPHPMLLAGLTQAAGGVVLEGQLSADRGLNTPLSMAPEVLELDKANAAPGELEISARVEDDLAVEKVTAEAYACQSERYDALMPVVNVSVVELQPLAGHPGVYHRRVGAAGVCWFLIYALDQDGLRSDPAWLTVESRLHLPVIVLSASAP